MQCRGRRSNGESFLAEVLVLYVLRKARPQSWQPSLRTSVRRQSVPPPGSGSGTLAQKRSGPPSPIESWEVLRLVVQGAANKEIASQMDISESAVKNSLQQLFGKTEVRNQASWSESRWNATVICFKPSLAQRMTDKPEVFLGPVRNRGGFAKPFGF